MIHLVGAGPGDPGLLTVRALELIRQADVVIYDALVSDEIMKLVNSAARKIYVGKRGREGSTFHSHPPARTITTRRSGATSQDEINSLLVREGRSSSDGNEGAAMKSGKADKAASAASDEPAAEPVIVRLKGGDPFVFGRGGEEALALAGEGIPFEVIPGISSAIAAPAYAGIPVTHRGLADSVTFITGMRDPDHEQCPDYSTLARMRGTLVFLMSASKLEEISAELIRCGRAPETPAAIIQWGTRANQRSLDSSLARIAEEARAAEISSPAVVVIGDVVSVREQINWFESRPLFGKCVVVTRARSDESKLAAKLREKGASVLEAPGITLRALPSEPLDEELKRLNEYSDVIFTSQNAVQIVADRLHKLELDGRAFAGLRIAAIGAATAEKIRSTMGLRVDIVPLHATGEGLCEALGEIQTSATSPRVASPHAASGRKFLFPRARDARDVIVKHLGDAVKVVPVYESIPADITELLDCLDQSAPATTDRHVAGCRSISATSQSVSATSQSVPATRRSVVDAILFGSAAAVNNFMASVGDRALPESLPLISIGPITTIAIEQHGFKAVTAKSASIDGLVEACVEALVPR